MMKIIESRVYGTFIVWTDYFLLGLLWLLMSLPIITLFHSTSALFSVIKHWKSGHDGRVLANFFKSFKSQFMTKLIIFTIFFVISSVIYIDFSILSRQSLLDKLSVIGLVTASLVVIALFIQLSLIDVTSKKIKLIDYLKMGAINLVTEFSRSIYFMFLSSVMILVILWVPISIVVMVPLTAKLICLGANYIK